MAKMDVDDRLFHRLKEEGYKYRRSARMMLFMILNHRYHAISDVRDDLANDEDDLEQYVERDRPIKPASLSAAASPTIDLSSMSPGKAALLARYGFEHDKIKPETRAHVRIEYSADMPESTTQEALDKHAAALNAMFDAQEKGDKDTERRMLAEKTRLSALYDRLHAAK